MCKEDGALSDPVLRRLERRWGKQQFREALGGLGMDVNPETVVVGDLPAEWSEKCSVRSVR